MKRNFIIVLFAALSIISCRKDEDCTVKAYKEPCYIAFSGFQPTELDTLIQKRYEPGTHFSKLISTDTLTFPNIHIISNVAYSSIDKTYMALTSPEADCELILPARTFKLSSITYSADSVVRWTSKNGCVTTASYRSQPWYLSVNDSFRTTETLASNNTRWIVLGK